MAKANWNVCNDAVLRAMEEYLGLEVYRSPYPGIMGAIGMALLAKEHHQKHPQHRTFIRWDQLDDSTYQQQSNAPCPFCQNHCKRTILTFSNGNTRITNNRCERGMVLGTGVQQQLQAQIRQTQALPNLFWEREKLLFQTYPHPQLPPDRSITIGLPRVLFSGKPCRSGPPSSAPWALRCACPMQASAGCTRADCLW